MGDLLETVLEAHGGLERWNQLDAVSALSEPLLVSIDMTEVVFT
jgi:hypothetical protein